MICFKLLGLKIGIFLNATFLENFNLIDESSKPFVKFSFTDMCTIFQVNCHRYFFFFFSYAANDISTQTYNFITQNLFDSMKVCLTYESY